MSTADILTNDYMRNRMLDLAYCLYECLSDLIDDAIVFDEPDDDIDIDGFRERVRIAAVNCLGDIEPLTPLLRELAGMK